MDDEKLYAKTRTYPVYDGYITIVYPSQLIAIDAPVYSPDFSPSILLPSCVQILLPYIYTRENPFELICLVDAPMTIIDPS